MLHLVTVATHSERYLPVLEKQSQDKDMKLVKLGMGKKYTGHFMKDLEMIDYLKTVPEEDLIIFADGFDTLLLGGKEEIVDKFKQFDCKLLLSIENIGVLNFIHSAVFQKVKGKFINTGLYMGYAGYLKNFLESMYEEEFDLKSNQKTWANYLEKTSNYKDIGLDTNSDIFLNYSFTTTNYMKIKNKRIELNEESHPCFIQGNGCEDLTKIIKATGYEDQDIHKARKALNTIKNNIYSIFVLYPIIALYIFVLIAALILFGIFFHKLYKMYKSDYYYIYL